MQEAVVAQLEALATADFAYARLLTLGASVIRTSDAAAALDKSTIAAARTLARLAAAGLVRIPSERSRTITQRKLGELLDR